MSLNKLIPIKKLTDKQIVTVYNSIKKTVAAYKDTEPLRTYFITLIGTILVEPKSILEVLSKLDPTTSNSILEELYAEIINYYPWYSIDFILYGVNNGDKKSSNNPKDVLKDILGMNTSGVAILPPGFDVNEFIRSATEAEPKQRTKVTKEKKSNDKIGFRDSKDIENFRLELKSKVIGQDEAIDTLINYVKLVVAGLEKRASFLFIGPTGTGKCFGKDTKIKMYDGSWKYVQDINIGDKLMGDDSLPRNVNSLAKGKDILYKVTPVKGDSFIVNKEHILCLRHTQTDEVIEIPIKEYINKNKNFKHLYKQYRVPVEYPEKEISVDPYYLGLWIGDGSIRNATIFNIDKEVITYIKDYTYSLGLRVSENSVNGKCPAYRSCGQTRKEGNILLSNMYKLGVIKAEEKFIPENYLRNSPWVQKQLLAGLLDSDGSLTNNCYDFISKYKNLSEQVVELSRSLGLAAYMKSCYKYDQHGKGGIYYRVSISGETSIIPCKVKRKISKPRKQIKNVLNTGFTVEELGIGDYYGFVIDGNKRFLLEDFTVTHNTELSKLFGEKYSGNFIKIDCGGLAHGHEYQKLIGSPPGYVGHVEKSLLFEKSEISNKWVFLFDEIEKAHEKFYNFLLSLLDDGYVQDNNGRTLDFTESIFIFTSNKGISDLKTDFVGFSPITSLSKESSKEILEKSLGDHFTPEFRNRIDEFVYFNSLSEDDAKKITSMQLDSYTIQKTPQLIDWIVKNSFSNEYGARNIQRFIKRTVGVEIANALFDDKEPINDTYFTPDIIDNKLTIIDYKTKKTAKNE